MKKLQEFKSGNIIEEAVKNPDPPMVLILKRKAIRLFPSGERVALYHSDKLGIDVSIPYNPAKKSKDVGAVSEEITESVHDDLFGNYTEALKKHLETGSIHTDHPELSKLKMKSINKYGKEAHKHLHSAAEHYLNGNVAKAARHYSKFERMVNEKFEEILDADFVSESIHHLNRIVASKQDGEIAFANGAKHKLSHAQASHIIKNAQVSVC